ncbi:MAG: FtsX-like permease family protein [Deltaproteobacteria bacterium]|nr:FtsX-like permease family protein [Deltaproteobacteria bacterium]
MGRLVLIAVRSLLANRRRNLLLGGAIAGVTLLLTLLGAVGAGIQHTMIEAGTALISGHVNVAGFYKISSARVAPVLTDRARLLRIVSQEVPGSRLVVDRTRGFGKLVSETDSVQAGLTGIDITRDREILRVVQVVEGDVEGLARPRTVMLYEDQAERLGVGVGRSVTITAPVLRGRNNSIDVEVVAIARELGLLSLMNCYVSHDTTAELYLLDPDTSGVIQVRLDDPADSDTVAEHLRAALPDYGYEILEKSDEPFFHKFQAMAGEDWTGLRLDITTWEDELSMMEWTLKTFSTITWLLTGILLVIIIIGVMNTLWISIRDRTREIGTLRAIGMRRHKVLIMVLLEVAILSVVFTGLGIALGALASQGLSAARIPVSRGFQIFLMSDTLTLVLDPGTFLSALLWIPVSITAFSLFPALRGARLKPITAIHHVG